MARYILTDGRERIITSKRTKQPVVYSSERLALVAANIFSKRFRKPILVWDWDDFVKVPGVDFPETAKIAVDNE